MHDTADYATIIHSRLASHILGQMRLDLSPLFVIQPKQIAPHDRHSESQAQRISNRFSQQRFYWVSALAKRIAELFSKKIGTSCKILDCCESELRLCQ